MSTTFSIADARHNLAALVHELDKKHVIELTRRGKPVAVLMSLQEYNRLRAPRTNFSQAHQDFVKRTKFADLKIDPKMWEGVRDTSPGREVEF